MACTTQSCNSVLQFSFIAFLVSAERDENVFAVEERETMKINFSATTPEWTRTSRLLNRCYQTQTPSDTREKGKHTHSELSSRLPHTKPLNCRCLAGVWLARAITRSRVSFLLQCNATQLKFRLRSLAYSSRQCLSSYLSPVVFAFRSSYR